MDAAARPKFSAFAPLVSGAGGEVTALGATDTEGVFIAHVLGTGLRLLDLSGSTGFWASTVSFSGVVIGSLGLHYQSQASNGESDASIAHVSLAEGLRTWICLRIPVASAGGADRVDEQHTSCGAGGSAEEVGRCELSTGAVAACGEPGDDAVALALGDGGGMVRFMDSSTGKPIGKGLKLGRAPAGVAVALVRLAARRVALIRCGGSGISLEADFFVVVLNAEAKQCELQHSGSARTSVPAGRAVGPLVGAQLASMASNPDRVVLCWAASGKDVSGRSDATSPSKIAAGKSRACGFAFASLTNLDRERPDLTPLPVAANVRDVTGAEVCWACVRGYVVEWSPVAMHSTDEGTWRILLRDAKHGMQALSGDMPFSKGASRGQVLVATAGCVTALVAPGKPRVAAVVAAVRWSLPWFTLQMVIGTAVNHSSGSGVDEPLRPLRDAVAGKRRRDDPEVEELLCAKRLAATDEALAAELRGRRWRPSHALVDVVVRRECWRTARALLTLPELEEDLAVRLLGSRPSLLPRVLCRASAPELLGAALRVHLPASQLRGVLEALLELVEARRDWPEEEILRVVPCAPSIGEVVEFLSALADGCMLSLVQLEADLLERTVEALTWVQHDLARTNNLCASIREACRIKAPLQGASHTRPVEVMLLPL